MADKIKCWCGMEVRPGRKHYPGNDPEDGPAHEPHPGIECPTCRQTCPPDMMDENGYCNICNNPEEDWEVTMEKARYGNICKLCEEPIFKEGENRDSRRYVKEESLCDDNTTFPFIACRPCFEKHGTPNNPDANEWDVQLPYYTGSDAIVVAHYPRIQARDEEIAILKATISLIEEGGPHLDYATRWKRANERPGDFGMEDLIPVVSKVSGKDVTK